MAFVTLELGNEPSNELKEELRAGLQRSLPAAHDIRFSDALPKTRSGKTGWRLLREIASAARFRGDTTTLEDFGVLPRAEE